VLFFSFSFEQGSRLPPNSPRENGMASWCNLEAERILDELTAVDGPDDLLVLQGAIERALLGSFEKGRAATRLANLLFQDPHA
jgi:hypothetical protein